MTVNGDLDGARLQLLRKAMGLEVEWLAMRFGVNERTVRRWQAGTNPIPLDVTMGFALLVDQFTELIETLIDGVETDGVLVMASGSEASPLDEEAIPPAMFNRAAQQAAIYCEENEIPYTVETQVLS